jgi:hypothetical protein
VIEIIRLQGFSSVILTKVKTLIAESAEEAQRNAKVLLGVTQFEFDAAVPGSLSRVVVIGCLSRRASAFPWRASAFEGY